MGYTSVTVILNPAAGSGTHQPRVRRAAEDRQIDVREMHPDDRAGALAREAVEQGAQVLVAAGGDGTLSAVAGVAAEHDVPLVVVPCGTRNHFAKDCGADTINPVGQLAAIDNGHEVRIDIGTVNGRVFLDNVAVGFYAAMVRDPQYRQRPNPGRGTVRPACPALGWATRIAAHRSTSPSRHP
jgi:diacylglycerol kinase family enzyme